MSSVKTGGIEGERTVLPNFFPHKNYNMNKTISNIESQIHDYNNSFQAGENLSPKNKYCPKCKDEVESLDLFKYYDQRLRHVKLVVEALVKKIFIILVRYKCPLCKRKFTLYPKFILPHKHYACSHVVELCENYLDSPMRYEDAPKDGNSRISYEKPYREEVLQDLLSREDREDFEQKESFMASTTVHRWLSWLSNLEPKLEKMLAIIAQASPQTDVFRKLEPVYSSKYRSEARKHALEISLRVLTIKNVVILGKRFFPEFAIDY